MSRLADKVVVVTGASSGIGRACAERFVEEGAEVILGDIEEEAGRVLAARLGDAARFVRLDVGEETDWERAIAAALDRRGRLDGVANIAGIARPDDNLEQLTEAGWREVLRVNLEGVFLGTRHGIAAMKATGRGSIVNISSIFCLVSESRGLAIAYTASKGGVRALSKSAALHCATAGFPIRVNTIHPGFIETAMVDEGFGFAPDPAAERAYTVGLHPMGRLGAPRDIADAALYLMSDESAAVTGTEIVIDGGYTAV